MKLSWCLGLLALFLLTQIHISFGTQPTTSLELSLSNRVIEFGERVTLTAVLENSAGDPIQGAQVLFFADDEFLGSRPTDPDGTARFTISPDIGTSILIAKFVNTEDYLASTSRPILLEVTSIAERNQNPPSEALSYSTIFLISILTLGGVGSIIIYVYSKSSKRKSHESS